MELNIYENENGSGVSGTQTKSRVTSMKVCQIWKPWYSYVGHTFKIGASIVVAGHWARPATSTMEQRLDDSLLHAIPG